MRDYANKRQLLKGETPVARRRPAVAKSSPKSQKKPKNKAPKIRRERTISPGWVWMISGLLVGLLVAFLVFIISSKHQAISDWAGGVKAKLSGMVHHRKATAQNAKIQTIPVTTAKNQKLDLSGKVAKVNATTTPATADKPATKTAQPVTKKPKVAAGPKFDFYTILPGRKSPAYESPTTKAQQAAKPKQFKLQVASYRDQNDANKMRARLLLVGLNPVIEKTASGWYRVDLGPFTSVRAADVVRHRIQKAGVNGSMVRQVTP